ncbi:ThyX-like thymidylate synthase [Rhodobacter phage RcIroh]|nr:ThyX-like thymidylate synthase [Rhodobacter phage RcIroh]
MSRQIDTSMAITRAAVPALDETLGHAYPILDRGFIRVIDYLGDDAAIVQAARVSYGKGTKSVSQDEGLIRYLMRHWHSTPFEMCELKLHVKLPIFVARQWIRHRTANVNEMSARYSILDNEFYIPAPHDLAAQSQVNNQGRGTVLTGTEAQTVLDMLRDEAARSYSTYEELMREDPEAGKLGLARELARMNLPTNIYTQWYWKVDLHNLFHFLRLRADAHAQFEIRAYAEVICDIVKSWVPLAYRAFEDYRMNAVTLSSMEIEALREYFAACQPDREHDGWPEPKGLSERESGEFFRKLGLMK